MKLAQIDSIATVTPPEADRELSLEDLRDFQYVIGQARKDFDDQSRFVDIDLDLRASISTILDDVLQEVYQGAYASNFHGCLSQAFRNTIEKPLAPKVMSFQRWETQWGKFKTDYNPV